MVFHQIQKSTLVESVVITLSEKEVKTAISGGALPIQSAKTP